jgi:hypothetical protein
MQIEAVVFLQSKTTENAVCVGSRWDADLHIASGAPSALASSWKTSFASRTERR